MTLWVVDTSPLIFLAKSLRAERVLLDDLDARRFARRIGLKPVGTLGLLLAARLRGEIPSVRAEIDHLRALGFRAAPKLIKAILQEARRISCRREIRVPYRKL